MGLLLGAVLMVLGGAVIWAGITDNEMSLLSMLGIEPTVNGSGSVGVPLPGEDSKHRPKKKPK